MAMENSANGHRHDDNGNKNSTTAAATTTATNQNDQTSSMTPKKFARTAPCRTSSRVKKKICLSSIVANNSVMKFPNRNKIATTTIPH
ncbi:hypothetical protein QR98_0011340 [Sarcoptes scabiei]|uniref:Uncharacterized protein n=1 Tax=Sarcoptes scabiei TaxID=52283 RepID=A0A131ZV88_SARSC|nr:hypothetical protein QR98_0011340 [Sarcoptes scabiei]